jgi:hypothetical protein
VIPSIESTLVAECLRRVTRVHHLSSPLISHATVNRTPDPRELWRLVTFWAALLGE